MGQRLERYRRIYWKARRDPMFDIRDLMEIEARGWGKRIRAIQSYGEPMAGLGFTGVLSPNLEPTAATPAAATTAETNLYTPSTAGGAAAPQNAPWAIIPLGNLRAPQTLRVVASGIATGGTSTATQTFWSRIGTSATPTSNASFSTHPFTWGTTTTNAMWWYEANVSLRSLGTTAGSQAVAWGVSKMLMGTVTGSTGGAASMSLAGNGSLTTTFDPTVQQGFVISTAATATTTTATLQAFCMIAWD